MIVGSASPISISPRAELDSRRRFLDVAREDGSSKGEEDSTARPLIISLSQNAALGAVKLLDRGRLLMISNTTGTFSNEGVGSDNDSLSPAIHIDIFWRVDNKENRSVLCSTGIVHLRYP